MWTSCVLSQPKSFYFTVARSIPLPRTGFVFLCSFLLFFSFPSFPTFVPPTRTSETLFLSNTNAWRHQKTGLSHTFCNANISAYLQTSMTSQKTQYACAVRSLRCFVETNASRYNESNVQTGSDFILDAIDTSTWEWLEKVSKTWKWRNFCTFTQLLKQSLSLLKQMSLLNWRPPEARGMDSDSSSARHCAGVWYLGTYKNYITVNPNAQRFPICVCVWRNMTSGTPEWQTVVVSGDTGSIRTETKFLPSSLCLCGRIPIIILPENLFIIVGHKMYC